MLSRKTFTLIAIGVLTLSCATPVFAAETASKKPIPVILTSDIGDDIDDTWALGLLLRSPELDLKLVVGDYGKTLYRAKLLAKFLQVANRTDVPVGIGFDAQPHGDGPQAKWVRDYNLNAYPGKVYPDGIQAMIDLIMNSKEPITLLSIGPMPNVAEALRREPRIAERARFVGMYGSVRIGYGGKKKPDAEWNVKADVKSCQKGFSAPWEMIITPLDTCGLISLDGEHYQKVLNAKNPIAAAIIENYRFWSTDKDANNTAAQRHSSILFDAVAVYLAFAQDLCEIERLNLKVTDDGFTVIDPSGKPIDTATAWKSLDGYKKLLVERLSR